MEIEADDNKLSRKKEYAKPGAGAADNAQTVP